MIRILHRYWRVARYPFGIAIAALVLWALSSHRDELSGLSSVFGSLNWWWVPPALLAETMSFVCFAGMEYELLRSADLRAPWSPLLKMTFANQAIANSVPGGSAAATVYGFRWFRRFGADDTLAAWAILGTVVASVVSLSAVAVGGLALATGEGASLDLVPVVIGVFAVTIAVGALFVYERPLVLLVTSAARASHRLIGRPRGDTTDQIHRIIEWITTVHLGWRQIRRIFLWGSANWLFDCACFAMMFLAVHADIPWKGLLLAYGAGQLAATLPITPGGLGVVEGSITIALVAFGGAQVATVDAVLMYRLVSFWLVLLVGWGLWAELALQVRRGRWNRAALSSEVEAGVEQEVPLRPRDAEGAVATSDSIA
ncbi:MAG TPA: lysylphosphatidylglycerol synthase transmembrane domain-containing protein [Acidimicrobiales bacterium]|nr:lysylphosphatidylglycerol synthase transmembrane domain-containing protein [Acidimicrobiales bacterium]